jgi:hypothetical protein
MRSIVLTVVVLLAGGCKDVPGADGRYATPARGGWDNFRAESSGSADRAVSSSETQAAIDVRGRVDVLHCAVVGEPAEAASPGGHRHRIVRRRSA